MHKMAEIESVVGGGRPAGDSAQPGSFAPGQDTTMTAENLLDSGPDDAVADRDAAQLKACHQSLWYIR